MDLTEEIREDMTMSENKKAENKTGDDSTETENSEKTISKNIYLNHRPINLIQNI